MNNFQSMLNGGINSAEKKSRGTREALPALKVTHQSNLKALTVALLEAITSNIEQGKDTVIEGSLIAAVTNIADDFPKKGTRSASAVSGRLNRSKSFPAFKFLVIQEVDSKGAIINKGYSSMKGITLKVTTAGVAEKIARKINKAVSGKVVKAYKSDTQALSLSALASFKNSTDSKQAYHGKLAAKVMTAYSIEVVAVSEDNKAAAIA